MNLEDLTTEELYKEIEKRKQILDDESILCIGIIDDLGAESLIQTKNAEVFAASYTSLSLRARFNGQRKPILYTVSMPQRLFDIFDKAMKNSDHLKAGENLSKLSTFKKLGY